MCCLPKVACYEQSRSSEIIYKQIMVMVIVIVVGVIIVINL